MRRNPELMRRAAERRAKEDGAERLCERFPRLRTLILRVEERMKGRPAAEVSYVRHIIVDRAPALFELPCSDRACQGGGHDLTQSVLTALARGRTRFEGEDCCDGEVRETSCDFELKFVAEASYG